MARIIILALVVALVVWWLTRSRRSAPAPEAPTPKTIPQDMVACDHCGLHLPRLDALPGRGGVFCSDEHRREHEARG